MILLRLRSSARVIALVLLAVSLRGVQHLQRDDDACVRPILDQHDESKHVIGAATAVDHEHCAICHWTRSPRRASAAPAPFAAPVASTIAFHRGQTSPCRAPALDKLPARAPPSVVL
jgi:hypothetical protein